MSVSRLGSEYLLKERMECFLGKSTLSPTKVNSLPIVELTFSVRNIRLVNALLVYHEAVESFLVKDPWQKES